MCFMETFRNYHYVQYNVCHSVQCIVVYFFQLKEFANFDFDVWRKRYMRWMNHKKSRVMDFFRRIDKDQDGKVTRQEFIEGILSSSKSCERIQSGLQVV